MSSVCIFNIVDKINDYDKLNHIARELVQTALDNELGISFNSNFYDLTKVSTIKNYFMLSNSFIYRHSDELLSPKGLWDGNSVDLFKKEFINRFRFFQILLDKLCSLGVEKVEIYFVDIDEPPESLRDFEVVQSNGFEFVDNLLKVVLSEMDEFGGTIPTFLKFEVNMDSTNIVLSE